MLPGYATSAAATYYGDGSTKRGQLDPFVPFDDVIVAMVTYTDEWRKFVGKNQELDPYFTYLLEVLSRALLVVELS